MPTPSKKQSFQEVFHNAQTRLLLAKFPSVPNFNGIKFDETGRMMKEYFDYLLNNAKTTNAKAKVIELAKSSIEKSNRVIQAVKLSPKQKASMATSLNELRNIAAQRTSFRRR